MRDRASRRVPSAVVAGRATPRVSSRPHEPTIAPPGFFLSREKGGGGGDARERRKASVAGPIARVRSRSRPTGHRLRAHHAARHQSRTRGRHRRRAARSPPKLFASRTRYPPGVPSQLCQKPYSEDASLREPFADRPSSVLPPNRPRLPPRRLPRLSSRRSARRMTST